MTTTYTTNLSLSGISFVPSGSGQLLLTPGHTSANNKISLTLSQSAALPSGIIIGMVDDTATDTVMLTSRGMGTVFADTFVSCGAGSGKTSNSIGINAASGTTFGTVSLFSESQCAIKVGATDTTFSSLWINAGMNSSSPDVSTTNTEKNTVQLNASKGVTVSGFTNIVAGNGQDNISVQAGGTTSARNATHFNGLDITVGDAMKGKTNTVNVAISGNATLGNSSSSNTITSGKGTDKITISDLNDHNIAVVDAGGNNTINLAKTSMASLQLNAAGYNTITAGQETEILYGLSNATSSTKSTFTGNKSGSDMLAIIDTDTGATAAWNAKHTILRITSADPSIMHQLTFTNWDISSSDTHISLNGIEVPY